MADENIEVDELVYRPNDYLQYKHGELGVKAIPAVRTHDQVMALVATMDQYETEDEYDQEGELFRRLIRTRDIIENDLEAMIEEHNE